MVWVDRYPDGTIIVHSDNKPVRQRDIREAKIVAQHLAAIREVEVCHSGKDIQELESYERAYWDFAEYCQDKLSAARKRADRIVVKPPGHYVIICKVERKGREYTYLYETRIKITKAQAIAAARRKHPNAKISILPLKKAR